MKFSVVMMEMGWMRRIFAGKTHLQKHQGNWRRFGEPFSPARHTWVGARMALFAMSLDGENHGGAGKFGPFRVTKA